MQFKYNTLKVSLIPSTRTLKIQLNRPEKRNALNSEMLFELEGLLGWLTGHLEVHSLYLTGSQHYFCSGLDPEELSQLDEDMAKKFVVRLQKIITGMLSLPQTIICDLQEGAEGQGLELALGADIRVARSTAKIKFNSLTQGWVPCAGGISLLSQWVGAGIARQWVLSSSTVNAEELQQRGLLLQTYASDDDLAQQILTKIAEQAPVSRIQAKRSFLESILPELSRGFEYESLLAFSSMITGDWKKKNCEKYTSARELAQCLKKTVS